MPGPGWRGYALRQGAALLQDPDLPNEVQQGKPCVFEDRVWWVDPCAIRGASEEAGNPVWGAHLLALLALLVCEVGALGGDKEGSSEEGGRRSFCFGRGCRRGRGGREAVGVV